MIPKKKKKKASARIYVTLENFSLSKAVSHPQANSSYNMDHWNSRLKILGNGFVLQRYFYHKRKWPFRWYLFRVPFSPRYLVSADSTCYFSSRKYYSWEEYTGILSGILKFLFKTNIESAGGKEVFLQKQQKKTTKFSLLTWNSRLLAQISAKANIKTSCPKAFGSPWKVELSGLGKRMCSHTLRSHMTENLTTETFL